MTWNWMNIINLFVITLGPMWLLYRFYQKRNTLMLIAAILIFSLGLKEQILFPEIKYDDVETVKGMDVTIVTTARTDEEAKALLSEMGMPFKKR